MNGSWIYNRIGYQKRYPIFFLSGSWREDAEAKKIVAGNLDKSLTPGKFLKTLLTRVL